MDNEACKICWDNPQETSVYYDNESVACCKKCAEKFDYDDAYHKIRPLIEQLMQVANSGKQNYCQRAFADSIMREHRTLQQLFFQWIAQLIRQYSELEYGWYDARNEDTVNLCKKIMEKFKDDMYFRYI
jgi:ribosome-binding protein aMBF1 (putative translation factor)